jgi:predicted MPP superfamily phosphohydrolase
MFFPASDQLAKRDPALALAAEHIDSLIHGLSMDAVLTLEAVIEQLLEVDRYQIETVLDELVDAGVLSRRVQYECARCETLNDRARVPCTQCGAKVNVGAWVFEYTRQMTSTPTSHAESKMATPIAQAIGILHLTDLHMGMNEQSTLWPNVKESFFDDLAKLHAKVGPWDVVVFTGDLTQRGSRAEFDAVDTVLAAILQRLQTLGSAPVILAVPGNHDLVRPSQSDALDTLSNWHQDPAIAKQFFDDDQCAHRQVVNDAFVEYMRWWNARSNAYQPAIRHGAIPGDFGFTFEKNGLRLAFVGMNSSFLHLSDKREGELAVDPRQLIALYEDPPSWLRQHDAALLLTHHPLAWLHDESAKKFQTEIDRPGRFAAHLFGHMHEAAARAKAEGGAPTRLALQGHSLFGIDGSENGQDTRIHGYAALRVEITEGRGKLTLWPRYYETNRTSCSARMVPDHIRYDLKDEAVSWTFTPLVPLLGADPAMVRDPK